MLAKLLVPLLKIFIILKQNIVLICIVTFGAMYTYLVYTSGQIAKKQPTDTAINQVYQGSSRPKIDSAIVAKLEELQDENIEVRTLFENARSNPFAE